MKYTTDLYKGTGVTDQCRPVMLPIPSWVYSTLIRNKINVMDFRNYGKVRSVLSLNDLRDWALAAVAFDTLEKTYRKDSLFGYYNYKDISSYFENLTDDQRKELEYSVKPIVGTEESISYIKNRLTISQDQCHDLVSSSEDKEALTYTFVKDVDVFYIVIKEGVINTLETREGVLAFSKKCLEQFYSMMSAGDASSLGIYSIYLKEIQRSVF